MTSRFNSMSRQRETTAKIMFHPLALMESAISTRNQVKRWTELVRPRERPILIGSTRSLERRVSKKGRGMKGRAKKRVSSIKTFLMKILKMMVIDHQ